MSPENAKNLIFRQISAQNRVRRRHYPGRLDLLPVALLAKTNCKRKIRSTRLGGELGGRNEGVTLVTSLWDISLLCIGLL